VRVPRKELSRGVGLTEDNIGDRCEARALPRREERVHAVPAIERNAKTVRLQHAVHIVEDIEDLPWVAVISDGAPGAVFIPHKVRRVRQHEVGAPVREGFQNDRAISLDNLVVHHFSFRSFSSRWRSIARSSRQVTLGIAERPVNFWEAAAGGKA
jgi:hypothetical protein